MLQDYDAIEEVIRQTLTAFLTTDGPMITEDVPKVMVRIRRAIQATGKDMVNASKVCPTSPRRGPQYDPNALTLPAAIDPDVADALEQCDRILALVEELPSRADAFGESVAEKVRGIHETIERLNDVTDAQQDALDNMERGVAAWLR